jgi:hypothetical protein
MSIRFGLKTRCDNDHIASQTVSSSNSLDSYCLSRTRHMIDSYPNSFRIAKHMLSTYPRESDLLSRSIRQSEGDKEY